MHQQSLPKRSRILKKKEFLAFSRHGKRQRTPHFVLRFLANEGIRWRLGISISRKAGNAVKRNRAKRILREIFRRQAPAWGPPKDMLVIVSGIPEPLTYGEVLKEIQPAIKP